MTRKTPDKTSPSLIEPIIANLHSNGRLRVWSLIVTILGDVVQPRGGLISMSDLLVITGHMKIEPGAIRTALSRLSREGWVMGKRQGRSSSYGFARKGLEMFGPASRRIYANPRQNLTDEWLLAIFPPLRAIERKKLMNQISEIDAVQYTENFAIWPIDKAPDLKLLAGFDCLCLTGTTQNIPNWIKTQFAPLDAEKMLQKFIENYKPLSDVIHTLSPLDALIVRILILHDWRRIILRYQNVPAAFAPPQWSMPKANRLIAGYYQELVFISEQYWPKPLSKDGKAIIQVRFT